MISGAGHCQSTTAPPLAMHSLLLTLTLLFASPHIQWAESESVETSTEYNYDEETTTEEWGWIEDVTDPITSQQEDATVEQFATTSVPQVHTFSPFTIVPKKEGDGEVDREEAAAAEQSVITLSQQIRNVLEGYKQHKVITLPGLPIPDPLTVPDIKRNFAGSPVHFTNNTVYGLSNFTVDHINTDIDKKQVFVALHMKRLVMLGNYSMKSWISKAAGPYNVTLLSVEASGAAEIEKGEDGTIQATDSEMDMSFTDVKVDLQNSGVMRGFLQGVMGSIGPVIFEAIKPSILKEVNAKIMEQVNAKIKTVGDKVNFPTEETSPIDKAVAEGRRYVRENGYDPYRMEEKKLEASSVRMTVSEFVLSGLSRFYRVGDVGLMLDKGNVLATIHLATKRLYGSCRWNVSFSDFFNRNGMSHFTIKQLQVKAVVSQSLDVDQRPKLVDLDIFLGPIRLTMDKSENFNFVIEFVVNTMPALIRHIIVDTLEIPIKMKVQEILDEVNVAQILNETLPVLDNMGL